MRSSAAILATLAALPLGPLAARQQGEGFVPVDRIAAVVGDTPIPLSRVDEELNLRLAEMQRTGRPVPAWGSVTVVAADPLLADILSTALLVLGPEAALSWARERPEIGVLVLEDHGGRVRPRWSPGLEAFLQQDSTLARGG